MQTRNQSLDMEMMFVSLCRDVTAKLRKVTEYYDVILYLYHDEIRRAANYYHEHDDDCIVSVDNDIVTMTLCKDIIIEFDRLHDEYLLIKTLVHEDICKVLIDYEFSDCEIVDVLKDIDEHIDIFVNDWKNDLEALSHIRKYYEFTHGDLQLHINGENVPILTHSEKIGNAICNSIYKSLTVDRSRIGLQPLFEHQVKLLIDEHIDDIYECVGLILDCSENIDELDDLISTCVTCKPCYVRLNENFIYID